MKRQAPSHTSPSLNTPANLAYKSSHNSSVQSFFPEETPTAAAVPSLPQYQHRQSPSSDTPASYSAGLFGRQRATKRQHLPDVNMPAVSMDRTKVSPLSTPAAHQRGASPPQDALDRFNARRGNRSSSASAPSKPAQQPVDALDRFNARKVFTLQTSLSHEAVAHSSGPSLHPAAQAHHAPTDSHPAAQAHHAPTDSHPAAQVHHAPIDPHCIATLQMPAPASSQQPSQSAGPQRAQQQQQGHRGGDALARFNRRRGFKASSDSHSVQGADAAAQNKSRLHPQASQQAQRPLDGLAGTRLHPNPHPHPSSHPHHSQSAGYQQASEGVQDREHTAEDSQQSQTTSLESQRVPELCGARPAVSLVQGFTATHTPDALDRVNSKLLARRKSRAEVAAAQACRASASPDPTLSSAHAQTVGIQVTQQPVDMSVDEVEQSSSAQMWQDDSAPSGMYSSRLHPTAHRSNTADLMDMARVANKASGSVRNVPLSKKRMRAFDDDGDEGDAGAGITRKKTKAGNAVPIVGMNGCCTSGKQAQQGGVFARLAQKCL